MFGLLSGAAPAREVIKAGAQSETKTQTTKRIHFMSREVFPRSVGRVNARLAMSLFRRRGEETQFVGGGFDRQLAAIQGKRHEVIAQQHCTAILPL